MFFCSLAASLIISVQHSGNFSERPPTSHHLSPPSQRWRAWKIVLRPPARKRERGQGADKWLQIIRGQWHKHASHHELCISWDNKYVSLIFAGVISPGSLSVPAALCPKIVWAVPEVWMNKQMILEKEKMLLDMYQRTAVVSHRSLCPAVHLPVQIDYPGGAGGWPGPQPATH